MSRSLSRVHKSPGLAGNAYIPKSTVLLQYYYPQEPHGRGEISPTSRPLKDGEVAEWILLDGTPATCSNIALHNIYPGEIDLVISGPNLGRNTSAAFAMSSGTLGAALSSALSKVRSIALSYGTVLHPTPPTLYGPAHSLSLRIIDHLWNNWGSDSGPPNEVDLYSVNIPLIEALLAEEGLPICWTYIWRNSYGRLFKMLPAPSSDSPGERNLVFKWSPDMAGLLTPSQASLPVGSDGWAISKGWASITPLNASYAEPTQAVAVEDRVWKMKL